MFKESKDALGNTIAVGTAKLVASLPENDLTYTNASGVVKSYKLVTAEVTTNSGKKTTITCQLHQANIDRMAESGREFTIGTDYLVTLQRVPRRDNNGVITLARISHLQNAVNDENIMDELFAEIADTSSATQASAKEVQAVN